MSEPTNLSNGESSQALSSPVFTETPLHYFRQQGLLGQAVDAEEGIRICEAQLQTYLILRGDPEAPAFVDGLRHVLGVTLPKAPGGCAETETLRVFWLGPTEWLIVSLGGLEVELEQQLRDTLKGHFSVVDVSGGYTMVSLSGQGVATLLKKSSAYDFHPDNFPQGKCVQTTFAKASALVFNQGKGCFDLIIRRSFSDYLLHWMIDAAGEFGVRFWQKNS